MTPPRSGLPTGHQNPDIRMTEEPRDVYVTVFHSGSWEDPRRTIL